MFIFTISWFLFKLVLQLLNLYLCCKSLNTPPCLSLTHIDYGLGPILHDAPVTRLCTRTVSLPVGGWSISKTHRCLHQKSSKQPPWIIYLYLWFDILHLPVSLFLSCYVSASFKHCLLESILRHRDGATLWHYTSSRIKLLFADFSAFIFTQFPHISMEF